MPKRKRRQPLWILNKAQTQLLAEFLANLTLVIIASLVIPQVFGLDTRDPLMLVLGLILAVLSLLISLIFLKRKK